MDIDIIKDEAIDLQEKGKDGFLKLARERAKASSDYWRNNYRDSENDVSFIFGEQWDEETKRTRAKDGRPTLTINKTQQFISKVVGDQRRNTTSIKVKPVSANVADVKLPNSAGSKDYSTSDVYEAIIRNIESISNAQDHYNTAFKHALEGGFGWLRVLTDYSQDDSFDLDLKIESVRNRWSVLVDHKSTQPDFSDMNYCFVFDKISRKEFEKRYPDKKIGDFDTTLDSEYDEWQQEETIRIAEYYTRVPTTRKLLLMTNGEVYWEDKVKDVLDELTEKNIRIQRERDVKTYKVKWNKITAWDILDSKEWDDTRIPVVPVLGREIDLKSKRYFKGLISDSKDAQRMLNYWQSAATERIALAPKAPWIADAKSIEGHETIWKQANTKNYSVLPYNGRAGVDKPTRTPPSSMPAAELQMASSMTGEMQGTIGIYEAGLGQRSNETSGKAIDARKEGSDTGTYEFIDNDAMAKRSIGDILVRMIPKVYDSNRLIRLRFPDGSGDFIEINKTIRDEQTGNEVIVHDLGVGKYDVVTEVGASFATKRQESAQNMLDFARAVPQAAQIAPDLIAQNMDFANADELTKRLKLTLPPQMLSAEEQEELQKDQPEPQPSPEQLAAQAEMEQKQQEQEFKMQELQAKGLNEQKKQQLVIRQEEVQLEQEKVKLRTAELNAENKIEAGNNGMDEENIKDMIADAIAELSLAK
jgi:hypothetical protein